MEQLFDAKAFAGQLAQALAGRAGPGGYRAIAQEAGVSAATITRALQGHPNLSHEAVLRLQAWMGKSKKTRKAA